MRQVGVIENKADAQAFSDYLLSVGYPNDLDEASAGWSVWVHQDQHLEDAKREFDDFCYDGANPKYNGAGRTARGIRRETKRDSERKQKLYVDVRTQRERGVVGSSQATYVLMFVSIVVYVLMFYNGEGAFEKVTEVLSIAPYTIEGGFIRWSGLEAVMSGEVWRLVTPILMHFGLMHIVFNMMWLNQLGSLIESRMGLYKFVVMVLVIAVISNLCQYWGLDAFRETPVLGNLAGMFRGGPTFGGMSGVVYGLLGYLWMKSKYQPFEGVVLRRDTVILMLIWLVLCMTGMLGPIANTAHLVGLLVGMAYAYVPYRLALAKRGR